jgi:thiamine-phosphate diphosphorylase
LPPHGRPPFRLLAISNLAATPSAASLAAAAAWFTALARAGVDAVQLREKHLDDRPLLDLARAARSALGTLGTLGAPGGFSAPADPSTPGATAGTPAVPAGPAGAPGQPPSSAAPPLLLINGRADVALAAGADGVHLPADGLPVGPLRARLGPGLLLGVSTHTLAEVESARRYGADYVVFGPVWESPGKTTAAPPAGLGALAEAAASGIPVYALGGVTLDRLAEVAATGSAGAAAIRLFQGETPLEQIVEAARAAFRRPRREPH